MSRQRRLTAYRRHARDGPQQRVMDGGRQNASGTAGTL